MEKGAEIGIIGGSGLYEPSFFEGRIEEVKIYTPFGPTSDFIRIGEMRGRSIAFLARHGPKHSIPPHKINYRANIWALKKIGVKRIISVSAVGSLRKDYRPGDFVCPDQFIDMTKQRKYSFYEGRMVAHVSMADPFCPELRKTIISTANKIGVKMHREGVYICIEGPRFSTKAESRLWRQWNCDIIGMTLVPEVNLAREAEICYAVIATITDYDVWAERPVTAEEVVRVMKENTEKAKKLLYEVIPNIPKERKCSCKDALKTALL